MDLQIVMRTARRVDGLVNYLRTTLVFLGQQGIPAERIHVFPTAVDLSWVPIDAKRRCTLHVPDRDYRSTENMGVMLSQAPPCDWVLALEDDLRPCADFLGSASRWIEVHMAAHRLATFFAVSVTPQMVSAAQRQESSVPVPMPKWNSSVAVAMRWEDARACGRWVLDHAPTWRVGPGFESWATHRGSDKMLAAWHQEAYPDLPDGLASVPCLVQHEGRVSSLRGLGRFGYVRAPVFTGRAWGAA